MKYTARRNGIELFVDHRELICSLEAALLKSNKSCHAYYRVKAEEIKAITFTGRKTTGITSTIDFPKT